MKKIYFSLTGLLLACTSFAQTGITITAADMPVLGDTLRWSVAGNTAAVNITQTGANQNWNFVGLIAIRQGVDAYKSAIQVNPLYTTISPTAYGYKVLDTLPTGGAGGNIAITDVYTFFNKKTSPSRFVAEGFAAKVSNLPIPATYSDEDEIYFFPLAYGNAPTTSTYYLKANIAGIGTMTQAGTRVTTVDGYGTIETPFTMAPIQVIRVKSEVTGNDTVASPLLPGGSIAMPRNMVEYKWLANGQHYPMMQVTTDRTSGTEVITSVRYRDGYRRLAVRNVAENTISFTATVDALTRNLALNLPATVRKYSLALYDLNGKKISTGSEIQPISISGMATGLYVLQLVSDNGSGALKIQL